MKKNCNNKKIIKLAEKTKIELISLTAHQLRTPLSGIKWTLQMFLDGDLGKITQEQRGFLEKIYSANERMIFLINDILNVTKIEEGKYLFNPALVDFEETVYFIINSYKEEIERRKINFEFKKSKNSLPLVFLDVEKIKLAIQNLLDNALRYTSAQGKVIISLNYAKKKIEFSIKDTGIGIPKEQQSKVFTKFFRASNVMKIKTEGSGLGLFIVKNIIEAHGGKIWFNSEENKGTSFHFTLPVKNDIIKK